MEGRESTRKGKVVVVGSPEFVEIYRRLGAEPIIGDPLKIVPELAESDDVAIVIVDESSWRKLRDFRLKHPLPLLVPAPGVDRNRFLALSRSSSGGEP